MITKELLKKEIDKIPENLLDNIFKFIQEINKVDFTKKRIHTKKLKGQFDDIDIRKKSYE